MKKILLFSYVILLGILTFSFQNVFAANICTSTKYNDLKKKASEIKAKWELKFDVSNNAYFDISFENVDENLMLSFMGIYYEPKDGKIVLENSLDGGTTYKFNFYGGYNHSCVEEYVYTLSLKVPKYNKYSEMEECKENSEWELCDKWYAGEINDENDFRNKLEEYLKSDEKKEVVKDKQDKENNKKIIITVVVVVVAIVLIGGAFIVKKNKVVRKKVNNEKK